MEYELKGDYFDGQFYLETSPHSLTGREASDGLIEKYCPANIEQKLWLCTIDHKHIDKVLESAQGGFKTWKKLSVDERCTYLNKYKECVVQRKDEIARAIALETGKPLWESQTEVNGVIAKVDVTIKDSLDRIKTQQYENIMPNTNGTVYYKPLGPCVVIGPFNFPCHLANGQILSALAAGNSVIFKPSEKTIYAPQLLMECFHQAGFPKGVVNFINGAAETAKRLVRDKSVKGIYFTGSVEVGKSILELASSDLSKLVALELGGKNTSIVHSDASMDHALAELLNACFLTSGQRCVSTSKVAIHKSLREPFLEKFHALAKKIIIDHPIDYQVEPFMGPLIDARSCEHYVSFMGMAKREGAEEVMRGKQLTDKMYKGYYVSPSIHFVEKPDPKSHFLNTEIFGPNCIFTEYNEIEEAIDFANYGDYGLAGSIFTNDQEIAKKCIDEIDVGIFNVNRSTVGASSRLPFGGVKDSGNHRPAAVAMIDSCVHPLSSLQINKLEESVDFKKIKGLA